ncbi:hypothetical protein B0T19DRAFT_438291 [Cercophora scortea]|uniref:C2H2-type domain-containing protein n=1 Tax=Cercophora scortea TaxID=314031 RepID=A0AAE0J669_9PEZI|nr:hypothetical protein B0T19DRAFT_438291 [Cercophora scortea]
MSYNITTTNDAFIQDQLPQAIAGCALSCFFQVLFLCASWRVILKSLSPSQKTPRLAARVPLVCSVILLILLVVFAVLFSLTWEAVRIPHSYAYPLLLVWEGLSLLSIQVSMVTSGVYTVYAKMSRDRPTLTVAAFFGCAVLYAVHVAMGISSAASVQLAIGIAAIQALVGLRPYRSTWGLRADLRTGFGKYNTFWRLVSWIATKLVLFSLSIVAGFVHSSMNLSSNFARNESVSDTQYLYEQGEAASSHQQLPQPISIDYSLFEDHEATGIAHFNCLSLEALDTLVAEALAGPSFGAPVDVVSTSTKDVVTSPPPTSTSINKPQQEPEAALPIQSPPAQTDTQSILGPGPQVRPRTRSDSVDAADYPTHTSISSSSSQNSPSAASEYDSGGASDTSRHDDHESSPKTPSPRQTREGKGNRQAHDRRVRVDDTRGSPGSSSGTRDFWCRRTHPRKKQPCDRVFARRYHLERHIKEVHLQVREVVCRLCDPPKPISRASGLARHERIIHSNGELVGDDGLRSVTLDAEARPNYSRARLPKWMGEYTLAEETIQKYAG